MPESNKTEDAILLLSADSRSPATAWKTLDRDITDVLFEKGQIPDPGNNAKSLVFAEEGLELVKIYLEKHFEKGDQDDT